MSEIVNALISGGLSTLGWAGGGLISKGLDWLTGGGIGGSDSSQIIDKITGTTKDFLNLYADKAKAHFMDTSMSSLGDFGQTAAARAQTAEGGAGRMFADDKSTLARMLGNASDIRNMASLSDKMFNIGERNFGRQADTFVKTMTAMGNPAAAATMLQNIGDVYSNTMGDTFAKATKSYQDAIAQSTSILDRVLAGSRGAREAYYNTKIAPYLVQRGDHLDSGALSAASSLGLGVGGQMGSADRAITNPLFPLAQVFSKRAGADVYESETQRYNAEQKRKTQDPYSNG